MPTDGLMMNDPGSGGPFTWMMMEVVALPDPVTHVREKVMELTGGNALGPMTRLNGIEDEVLPWAAKVRLTVVSATAVRFSAVQLLDQYA